jgi:hypothetical protein
LNGVVLQRPFPIAAERTTRDELAIFDDADDLPDSFDNWLVLAEKTAKQVSNQGMMVIRAEIDPDTFPQWCADRGHANIDSYARIAYANFVAMQHLTHQLPSD